MPVTRWHDPKLNRILWGSGDREAHGGGARLLL